MRIGVVYRILIRILINIAAQLRLKRINLNYIHITYALSCKKLTNHNRMRGEKLIMVG